MTAREMTRTVRAEALFVSALSGTSRPRGRELADAIQQAIQRYGGVSGCVAEVAYAYGDHPEAAVVRMRWACRCIDQDAAMSWNGAQ